MGRREEMRAADIKQQTGGCQECLKLLNNQNWDKIPKGYGTNVCEVRVFGTQGTSKLCNGHREESTNTLGRMQ